MIPEVFFCEFCMIMCVSQMKGDPAPTFQQRIAASCIIDLEVNAITLHVASGNWQSLIIIQVQSGEGNVSSLLSYETLHESHLYYMHLCASFSSLNPSCPFLHSSLSYSCLSFTAFGVLKSWICKGLNTDSAVKSTDYYSRGLRFNS